MKYAVMSFESVEVLSFERSGNDVMTEQLLSDLDGPVQRVPLFSEQPVSSVANAAFDNVRPSPSGLSVGKK